MGKMIAALLFILVVALAALAAALPFAKNAALRDEIAVTR